ATSKVSDFQGGQPSANKVGDLSPKGRVGDSRPALVLSRQSDSEPFGNTDCQLNTGSELPCGNATFRRKVAHLLSAKHHRLRHFNYSLFTTNY
ncbi:MAG: hypothetical protein LBI18_10995, partial [Planctomycetaceae bacterium]|nr:hypothetical protein [Planctomycetaceae bacterium]